MYIIIYHTSAYVQHLEILEEHCLHGPAFTRKSNSTAMRATRSPAVHYLELAHELNYAGAFWKRGLQVVYFAYAHLRHHKALTK